MRIIADSRSKEQIWNAQREQFLRHPSLRSNDRDYHSENGDASKKKKGKNRDFKLPTVIVQDWSSLPPAGNVKPPPRPPRPSSAQIPYVIITPCAPTDSEEITSTIDDFPFNSAISSPLDAIAALALLVEPPTMPLVLRDSNKKRLIAYVGDSKPGSDPPILEQEMVEANNVLKRDNPFAAPSHLSVYSPQTPLVLSESLTKISCEPKDCSGNSHAAICDTLTDNSWNPGPLNDSPNTRTFSYTTSTPVKRRRLGMSDSELVFEADSLESDASTPHGLRLPEDQIDLLPYPDVFDLDMYFGSESSRSSLLPQYGFSPSIIRVPIEDRNPFLVSNTTVLGTSDTTRKITKRFGFVPEVSANSTPVSPVMRETRRPRDQYRHHAYSRSPQVAIEDTSSDSVVSITPPRLNPLPRMGLARPALRELNENDARRSSSQEPSLARRVQFLEHEQYPGCSPNPSLASEKVKLPIVIISHCRSPSSSTLSDESSLSEESVQHY